MELHSAAAAKRLWSFLRVTFFMTRKGLLSKRKLVMDMNLVMRRSGKILGKNLGNLVFHHHHHRSPSHGHGFGLQEYEFSCTTSPNPVFFHSKRRGNYFPCLIGAVVDEGDETPRPAATVPRINYSPSPCSGFSWELASGEINCRSPLPLRSPFSVHEGELAAEEGSNYSREVDDEAEDFIRRFYEQLRGQSRVALIECQELEYPEMIERGR